jgi:gallate decarboxylase subunit D
MKPFSVSVKKGRLRLEARSQEVGEDLVVVLWGGSRPHVGAVALALTRPSLKNKRKQSATASVLTVLGHKEDQTVKTVAEGLAAALKRNVVVTAGLHWDRLTEAEIGVVTALTERLAHKITERVAPLKGRSRV